MISLSMQSILLLEIYFIIFAWYPGKAVKAALGTILF